MTNSAGQTRIDSASRVIQASPQTIYQALVDPKAVVRWRPPADMQGRIDVFEPRPGGAFRMELTYTDVKHTASGKTSEHGDVVEGRFLEQVPNERVVERVEFVSDDPAFAGAMTITTTLVAQSEGTEVTIRCENVPDGIQPSDHELGMMSSLENLAAYTE